MQEGGIVRPPRPLGKACAIALAEAGANVIILSRTKNDLDKVEKIIKKLKRKCTSYVCDVSNYDALKNVFKKISSLDNFE
jgi:NAD(P)-dependent dehydrogenase (short-subunit alcohol dehydrogenase family)